MGSPPKRSLRAPKRLTNEHHIVSANRLVKPYAVDYGEPPSIAQVTQPSVQITDLWQAPSTSQRCSHTSAENRNAVSAASSAHADENQAIEQLKMELADLNRNLQTLMGIILL
ncbi:unnamed protein product [Dicrocoelium dendriticum]|nr:unnamed protein product [Dicrocoelium dendriticum]